MPPRRRLDQELVRRKIARSRGHAQDLIDSRKVTVAGLTATKAATLVDDAVSIALVSDDEDWASRGAHKLSRALDVFGPQGLEISGARVLDAGASTGGFTDVVLRRGARSVVAVDVGYGQLVTRLASDPRVTVMDRTNVRYLTADQIGGSVDLVVGDLSFISLTLVLPVIRELVTLGGSVLPMVKPQFEVGRAQVPKGGIVRDPILHREAVTKVAHAAVALGFEINGCTPSGFPGAGGNIEFFLWLRATDRPTVIDEPVSAMIGDAVRLAAVS